MVLILWFLLTLIHVRGRINLELMFSNNTLLNLGLEPQVWAQIALSHLISTMQPTSPPQHWGAVGVVLGIFYPMCSLSLAPSTVTPPLLQALCQTSGSQTRTVFWIELWLPKTCWSPNARYLWLWPYLETGALQMIKLRWSH